MQINKLLRQIGISSALLIGSLNAETTINSMRWPTPYAMQDALSTVYLRMHHVFKEKTIEIYKAQADGCSNENNLKLTAQECTEILNYLNKEQLFGFYNKCFLSVDNTNEQIPKTDEEVIQRVLKCNSESKSVLLVGFEQSTPTEGSEIRNNTQGYEKSIFTSAWEKHPGPNYNALKCDFLQYAYLLEKFPELNNFFDYIIVGGQTVQYVPAETWEVFGKLLKNSGLLLFTDIFQNENILNIRNYVKDLHIASESFLSKMFLNPQEYNMRGNYIANTICHFIAHGAGDISAYKCHIEKNEDLNTLGHHQELAQKIQLGLKLAQFNNTGSYGEFYFGMRPIELVVVEKKENQ